MNAEGAGDAEEKQEEEEDEDEDEDKEQQISKSAIIRARAVFSRANKHFKDTEQTESVCSLKPLSRITLTSSQRVQILREWEAFEGDLGTQEDHEKVKNQMPRRVTKRRKVEDDKYVEYTDYVFPADDKQAANLSKLLQKAHQWKQTQS
jgi:crooked neck